MLLVVCKGNTILGVLDGGASVSIITKRYWEKMGLPQLEVVDFHVKLANGGLVKVLRLLQNLKVKVLDRYVLHTFTVMGFNDKTSSFEMILKHPFMRDHQMIHDWSTNQVYVTLNNEHVHVSLKTRKYQHCLMESSR